MTFIDYINEVNQAYDSLTAKLKADLENQYQQGRIKGTEYAEVYTKLMSQVMQLSTNLPLSFRQTKGFDDNMKLRMLKDQLDSWALMFSSGLLDDKPAIIANDEVTTLYNNLKSELGL